MGTCRSASSVSAHVRSRRRLKFLFIFVAVVLSYILQFFLQLHSTAQHSTPQHSTAQHTNAMSCNAMLIKNANSLPPLRGRDLLPPSGGASPPFGGEGRGRRFTSHGWCQSIPQHRMRSVRSMERALAGGSGSMTPTVWREASSGAASCAAACPWARQAAARWRCRVLTG